MSGAALDAIVVGAGPNGLAAAIDLARAGRSVRVYEAADRVGGGTRSAELTLPGFVHDPPLTRRWHPRTIAATMTATQPAEPQPRSEPAPATARRARRSTPPTGWQFSRPAIVAREITARLIGPFIGWFLEGPRVVGREHLAALEGPALICPTHASHFDFSAIRLALGPRHRRRMTAAAAADYFATKKSRWFMAAWLGAFAFNRTGRGADSIAAAEGLLQAGWHVVLFPEGTRTMTGEINPFQPGIGLLARHTGRQVLPVRIVGIRQVLPKGGRRPHRHPVEVRIGAPIRALPGEDARAFTARLEAIVRAL